MVVLIIGGGTTEATRALFLTRQLSVPVKPIQVFFFYVVPCFPFAFLINIFLSGSYIALNFPEFLVPCCYLFP